MEIIENEKKNGRGKKKAEPKEPKRDMRIDNVRKAIISLPEVLVAAGYGAALPPPGKLVPCEEPDVDPHTGGYIAKIKEPLGVYLQRVSVVDNLSQRPPYDHTTDPIYRRLITHFLGGAAMPESKVAALVRTTNDKLESIAESQPGAVRYSIIDGLQRLYCFGVAVLLVSKGETVVKEGLIGRAAWDYFKPIVESLGEPRKATLDLLAHPIRYELFYNIDLKDLLHYMVTFNTGQRRMSLSVQLEIMQQPLIDELKRGAKMMIHEDLARLPGAPKPKDQFDASELVLAMRAFLSANAYVTAGDEAEKLLEDGLDNFGEIGDAMGVFKRVSVELQPAILKAYAEDPGKRYLLSNSSSFLYGFMAACGFIKDRGNMKMLDGALDKLLALFRGGADDPMRLDEYADVLSEIVSSRGKSTRRLVYDTFLRFFQGVTTELEWRDTFRSMPR